MPIEFAMGDLQHMPCRTGWVRLWAAFASVLLLGASPAAALMISEVLFNPTGPDNGNEFVELFNDSTSPVDLANYSLGWGGADYTTGTLDLDPAGLLAPGAYIVIGGPSDPLGFDFNPDLENGVFAADGVALFDVDAASIGGAIPIDAVIYGTFFAGNFNGLIDETGTVATVDAVIGAAGESVALDANGNWTVSATPTPGSGPLVVAEPSTAVLVAIGLLGLLFGGRSRA